MEKALTLEYGIGGICVLLTLSILLKVGEFLWGIKEKKDFTSEITLQTLIKTLDKNNEALAHLSKRIEDLEKGIAELPRFKTDIRRFYNAMKIIAGDDWSKIRDEIAKDDFNA